MWLPAFLSLNESANIECKRIAIMPFLSSSSKHLSPVNAIDELLTKINTSAPAFVIMITAAREDDFINQLTNLENCWSLQEIKKAKKISETLKTLSSTEMILPNYRLNIDAAPISTAQSRAIDSAQKTGKQAAAGISDMQSALTDFNALREQKIQEIEQKTNELKGGIVPIFFSFDLVKNLKENVPNETHNFTFLLAFTGKDVIKLMDLIKYDII